MRLSALILVAGIGPLALFACAPTAPVGETGSQPSPTPVGGERMAAVCVGGALQPVPFVKPPLPYDPTSNTAPTPDDLTVHPVNPVVQADLAAAFAAVPQLCSLNGIFIDPSGCTIPNPGVTYDPTTCNLQGKEVADHSWGLRIYNTGSGPNPGPRYIGISLGLWNNGCQAPQPKACAPPFESFKTLHILALLDRTAEKGSNPHNSWSKKSPPSHSVEPPTFAASSANSVLAVLAHEYGHVYWFDNFVQPPGSSQITNTFCNVSFYPSGSWGGRPVGVPTNRLGKRWADFGDISPAAGPDVQGLPNQIDSGGYPGVADALHRIHSSGQWASALAAFSPDEDFVETFELWTLGNAGLQKLTFKIDGHSDIVFPAAAGSGLATKLSCFH
jgi:hypothetical protein